MQSQGELQRIIDAPGGTVTFLFTDIEGSTKLLERLRDDYASLLEQQRDLLRAAFTKWNGHEIDTQGDSFFVAFPRALEAVNCVIAAQDALATHEWPQGIKLQVRMGLHTGEPIVARTGYVGIDVHRAARIASAGHGGQVLVSRTTRELIYQDLPKGAHLRDLGEYNLKDIRFPQRIYQLEIEGFPVEFPALKTLSAEDTPPTPGETPYKGLQYFDEDDEEWFFGRQEITARLVESVYRQRFLAVIGASGSGKSSVVRAGLIPTLKKDRSGSWKVYKLTPTVHPLEALAISLTRGVESTSATAVLIDDMRIDPRSLHLFINKIVAPRSKCMTLLVIDQFEELFTQCRDEVECQAFIDNLVYAAQAEGGPVQVVITLRADFYECVAQYSELRELISKGQEYIGTMSTSELRQVIEEPARLGGWEIAPGLVDLMLYDIGAGQGHQPEPGALPLLSHALLETWRRRRGNLMNLHAYTESGGVRGAIAHTADIVFTLELSPELQDIAKNIFLRLTELGDGIQDTRRRISINELIPPGPAGDTEQIRAVLNKLADARLITTGEGTVEIAHEALIREWPTLREWLATDREGLRLQRNLADAVDEWELLKRDPGALYRGSRLAGALDWGMNNPRQLSAKEQEFLTASKEAAEREAAEREAQQKRELEAAQKLAEAEHKRAEEQASSSKRLRQRAAYLVVALVIALSLAAVALFFYNRASQNAALASQRQIEAEDNAAQAQAQRASAQAEALARATAEAQALDQSVLANQQTLLATARELALAAILNIEIDPERSILLALQSLDITQTQQGEQALHRALAASRVRATFSGQGLLINAVQYSPDGSSLATAGQDGTVVVRNAQSGIVLHTLQVSQGNALTVAFHPEGKLLAAAGDDGAIGIWDAVSGELLKTLDGPAAETSSVSFSPDGSRLAAVSLDDLVRIWNLSSDHPPITFNVKTYGYYKYLSFTPDGDYLAVFDAEGSEFWNLETSELSLSLPVGMAEFSPDGRLMAGGSVYDVVVVDLPASLASGTGQILYRLSGHVGLIFKNSFNHDGSKLISASNDGTANIWSISPDRGELLLNLAGHSSGLRWAAFNPEGTRVATTSTDGTVRIWDVSPMASGELLGLAGHSDQVPRVTFSPDGSMLASASYDGTSKVWDFPSGQELFTLVGHVAQVWDIDFSPDGKVLATASADYTIKLWDTKTGLEIATLSGHKKGLDANGDEMLMGGLFRGVQNVDFSPAGHLLASAGSDGMIRLWDIDRMEELTAITGHPDGLPLSNVVFSPDGRWLTASSDAPGALAQLWQVGTDQAVVQITQYLPIGRIWGLSFSPDGTRLATSGFGGAAFIVDTTTGETLFRLSGHTSTIGEIHYSPDGAILATNSADGSVRLWDASDGEEIVRLIEKGSVLYRGIAFSPDGKYLALAGSDRIVRVSMIDIGDLVSLAVSRLTRSLTEAECQQFLHLEACP